MWKCIYVHNNATLEILWDIVFKTAKLKILCFNQFDRIILIELRVQCYAWFQTILLNKLKISVTDYLWKSKALFWWRCHDTSKDVCDALKKVFQKEIPRDPRVALLGLPEGKGPIVIVLFLLLFYRLFEPQFDPLNLLQNSPNLAGTSGLAKNSIKWKNKHHTL